MLFKHIEKTGGRTLVAWLAQLPWVTYVPGSYAMQLPRDVQVHPGSLKDFLQPYVRPITQSNHTEASLQLEFTSGRCGVAKNDVSAPAHGPDGCGPHGYGARASAIFSRLDCATRCLECKGCRFASFNARAGDCSLYTFCEIGELAHDVKNYETVEVSNSPHVLPFRKTLSDGELFEYFFQRLGLGGFASLSHILPEDELEGSDAPPRERQPLAQRAGRIAIEIHGPPASDWGSLLAGIEVLHQSPSPCMATSVTIVREPLSYYRSKYIFHVASFPWAMRGKAFLEWLHATPNDQSRDLLLGAARRHQTLGASEADAVASLLRRIDIVATLDRFDDLVRLLCARLALPRCPCYKPQNSAPMAKFVQETTSLQREYNKSNLSPSAQFEAMVLSRGHGATVRGKKETRLLKLHTQVREVAWLDEMLYTQASIDFSARIAAEGLRWGRENTTMKCGI